METIKFDNPIQIDGETITEVTYDMNEIDNGEYLAACMRAESSFSKPKNPAADLCFLFAIGVAGILAANRDKGWTADDFARLKGVDNWKVTQVAYGFFMGKRDESQEETSEP